jgi:hypothetical protein
MVTQLFALYIFSGSPFLQTSPLFCDFGELVTILSKDFNGGRALCASLTFWIALMRRWFCCWLLADGYLNHCAACASSHRPASWGVFGSTASVLSEVSLTLSRLRVLMVGALKGTLLFLGVYFI